MDYSSTGQAQEFSIITQKEMISHFANAQKMNQSGIIDKYYNYWANRLGIQSIQCRRLAELFSAAVDAPKTGQKIIIPAELRPPKTDQGQIEENQDFVWVKMLNEAKKFRQDFQKELIEQNRLTVLSKETLLNIFYQRRCPHKYELNNIQSLDEYTLIMSTINWANQQDHPQEILKDFIYLFDLTQLTIEQKQNIELSLRIKQQDLYSTLTKSRILSKELIEKYHLSQSSLPWRLFYFSPKLFNIQSQLEYEQTFQPIIYLFKQDSLPQRTLINISIDDTITLILDIYKDALIEQINTNKSQITFQIQSGTSFFDSNPKSFVCVCRIIQCLFGIKTIFDSKKISS